MDVVFTGDLNIIITVIPRALQYRTPTSSPLLYKQQYGDVKIILYGKKSTNFNQLYDADNNCMRERN